MWDRIYVKKAVEKVYGRLTRLSLTMYECVGMIAYNHLEKIKIASNLKEELVQQQRELNRIEMKITEIKEFLHEESELADSIFCLSKDMNSLTRRTFFSLEQAESLIKMEEENSSDIWRTLHADKVLLNESIRVLGKSIKKEEPPLLAGQEKRTDELMKNISTMIHKKQANQPSK